MTGSSRVISSVFAAAIIAAYGWFVFELANTFIWVKDPVGQWDHALTIFSSLTAFASAAAGVLLGTAVQTANTATAQRDKAQAEQSQHRMKEIAQNGLNEHATPRGGSAAEQADGMRRALNAILAAI